MIDNVVFSANALTLTAFVLLVGLAIQVWLTKRQVAKLEARLAHNQLQLAREIKQVNQGAIGVGRRFAKVEKALQTGPKQPVQERKTAKPVSAEKGQKLASKFSVIHEGMSSNLNSQPTLSATPANQPSKSTQGVRGLTTKAEASLTAWLSEQSA